MEATMFSDQFLAKIHSYFPNFVIKYKNHSVFMKFLWLLLFFSKSWMADDTNTLGVKIYFPNEAFAKNKPLTSKVLVLHGLVHMYDEKKLGRFFFNFLYLFPQILILPTLLLFLVSWKITLPIIFLLSLPLPAYFRMIYEKRAYLVSLYCMGVLNSKYKYNIDVWAQSSFLSAQFNGFYYYYMWPFKNVRQEFDAVVVKINEGFRPFDDDELFDMLDDILSVL